MKNSNDIVWSIYTRIIHWVVAIIVLLNTFIVEEGDPPHRYMGYLAVFLILVRITIGIKGNYHEKFVNFPISFKELKLFFKTHFKRTHHYSGHNPLASIVYIGIWAFIVALGVTGWMMGLDAFFGEEWLEDIHSKISNILLVLIVFHLIGIAVDSILYKRKTWLGMISGKREKE